MYDAAADAVLGSAADLPADLQDLLTSILTPFLTTNPIVHRLAQLQASLDYLDIEGLQSVLLSQKGIDLMRLSTTDIEKLGGEAYLSEYEAFVERYASTLGTGREGHLDISAAPRDAILAYLLSATFKDCSLFIRIRKHSNTNALDMSAFLVDCDVKSIQRLRKWAVLDDDIVETFIAFEKAGCVVRACKV